MLPVTKRSNSKRAAESEQADRSTVNDANSKLQSIQETQQSDGHGVQPWSETGRIQITREAIPRFVVAQFGACLPLAAREAVLLLRSSLWTKAEKPIRVDSGARGYRPVDVAVWFVVWATLSEEKIRTKRSLSKMQERVLVQNTLREASLRHGLTISCIEQHIWGENGALDKSPIQFL